jgi:hypothetical protein
VKRNLKVVLGEKLGVKSIPVKLRSFIVGDLPCPEGRSIFVEVGGTNELNRDMRTEIVNRANPKLTQFFSHLVLYTRNNIFRNIVLEVKEQELLGSRLIGSVQIPAPVVLYWCRRGEIDEDGQEWLSDNTRIIEGKAYLSIRGDSYRNTYLNSQPITYNKEAIAKNDAQGLTENCKIGEKGEKATGFMMDPTPDKAPEVDSYNDQTKPWFRLRRIHSHWMFYAEESSVRKIPKNDTNAEEQDDTNGELDEQDDTNAEEQLPGFMHDNIAYLKIVGRDTARRFTRRCDAFFKDDKGKTVYDRYLCFNETNGFHTRKSFSKKEAVQVKLRQYPSKRVRLKLDLPFTEDDDEMEERHSALHDPWIFVQFERLSELDVLRTGDDDEIRLPDKGHGGIRGGLKAERKKHILENSWMSSWSSHDKEDKVKPKKDKDNSKKDKEKSPEAYLDHNIFLAKFKLTYEKEYQKKVFRRGRLRQQRRQSWLVLVAKLLFFLYAALQLVNLYVSLCLEGYKESVVLDVLGEPWSMENAENASATLRECGYPSNLWDQMLRHDDDDETGLQETHNCTPSRGEVEEYVNSHPNKPLTLGSGDWNHNYRLWLICAPWCLEVDRIIDNVKWWSLGAAIGSGILILVFRKMDQLASVEEMKAAWDDVKDSEQGEHGSCFSCCGAGHDDEDSDGEEFRIGSYFALAVNDDDTPRNAKA